MTDHLEYAEPWIEPLCSIALRYRDPDTTIYQLFVEANPDLENPNIVQLVARHLSKTPELVDAWQAYSADKRSTPSPYLNRLEVGFFDPSGDHPSRTHVQHHETELDACADFIVREAFWTLQEIRQQNTNC